MSYEILTMGRPAAMFLIPKQLGETSWTQAASFRDTTLIIDWMESNVTVTY